MSRTDKDLPFYLGGNRHKYWTLPTGHAKFTRQVRRMARAREKQDMRRGVEPAPIYPVERSYFD